jgi:hypothetical protein
VAAKLFRVIKKAIVNVEHRAGVQQQVDQKQKGRARPAAFFQRLLLPVSHAPGARAEREAPPGPANYFFFDFLAFFAFFAFFAFLAIASSFGLMD